MDFNTIVFRMFKSNFKRYLLFFLCSAFTITIFFMYATLFTNKQFMDSRKMYYSISSCIIAPSCVIGIFSIFFIIYAQRYFNKFRKSEFGLLMVLGCTNKEIRKVILVENSLIAIISLAIGLGIGSMFSKLFYIIIIKITGLKEINFTLNFAAYLYTIVVFMAIYAVVILITIISTMHSVILDLIKGIRKVDEGRKISPLFILVGILAVIGSMMDIIFNYSPKNSVPLFRSIGVCFIGTHLVISNLVWINEKVSNFSKKLSYKNMLFNSNFKSKFGKSKNVLLINTWIIFVAIFLVSFMIVLISNARKSAIADTPYHIAYMQQSVYNNVPEDIVSNIVKNGQTKLTEHKDLNFIQYSGLFVLLSQDDLNKTLGYKFNIKPGHFINLNQIANDGYYHEINDFPGVNIELKNKSMNFITQGHYNNVIFNTDVPIFSSKFIALNNSDYLEILRSLGKNEVGIIRLFKFQDWKQTQNIVDKLNLELQKYNNKNSSKIGTDLDRLTVSSRIDSYKSNIKVGSFALFLMIFVIAIFFMASNVLLHFKLLMEFEDEKQKYKKIYKIGITKKEVSAVVNREIKILFFLPVIAGLVIAAFYVYIMCIIFGQSNAMSSSLLVGITYICLQIIIYIIYKRFYINKLLDY
ncbi:FtsX-like permease family protein [Clostridium sp. WILCCON 0269]|uniref:FtsX-like permease family protein n=1 Tax=Candidatus Clostridium eludens TaxID=3381663 RepID=A0ABW8SII0_9CLOT